MTELDEGKVKQFRPFANERMIFEMLRVPIKCDLRFFDQRRVTTYRPRNKPMDDQLRGIVDVLPVDFDAHGLDRISRTNSISRCL